MFVCAYNRVYGCFTCATVVADCDGDADADNDVDEAADVLLFQFKGAQVC